MKKSVIFFIIMSGNLFFGQNIINKDLDFDGVEDRVFIDSAKSVIVCELSTQNFKPLQSKFLGEINDQSGVIDSKDGFSFIVNWMRAGHTNQFRYNKKTKKIQLIGMSRYEFGYFGNGAGESSLNLLTSTYIGNWEINDYLGNGEEGEIIKIPIRTDIKMKSVYLEDFGEEIPDWYSTVCTAIFQKKKDKILKSKGIKVLP